MALAAAIDQLNATGNTALYDAVGFSVDRFTPDAVDALAAEGFDPAFGARPLKRTVQRRILNDLAKKLLRGEVQRDAVVLCDAVDGAIFFTNTQLGLSQA